MNFNADVNGVPHHHAHGSHFHDYIEEFHGLESAKSFEDQHKVTMNKLRNQLLNENNWAHNICLRNCFKLSQKRHVEFCLDRKCGGVDFLKAANILGYAKQ